MARTAARALELLSLLQTADRWSGPALAARMGVSLRTVRRDIDALRELGYPVDATGGRESTYRLRAGATLPPLLLDGEQAVAIALALQTAPTSVLGLREASDRAIHTLSQVLPAPLKAQVEAMRVTTARNFWEFTAPPIAVHTLQGVGDAVRRGQVLRVEKLRADGSRPAPTDGDFVGPARIEPHQLVLWAGRWYLLAFDSAGGAWRVDRVDRLHVHQATGRAFTRRDLPATDVADYVARQFDRGDVIARWPCTAVVLMDLPAEVVARWAPGGSVVEYVDATRAKLTIGAWSWAGIAGILATFDAPITIVEPPELTAACRELARRYERL